MGLRIKTADGWYPVPCKRRTCPVCGPRRNREDARVLVLDAREQAPTHCITLTTVDPETTSADYREASRILWRRLRRLYGRVEYYGHIEWTTGRAARSGGLRRLHGHYLVKFLDRADVDVVEVEAIVRSTWRECTGAYLVEVAALISPGAAIGYLSLHHRKPEQAAPIGWRGMVGRPSQGYFHRPLSELRELARHQLRVEAVAHSKGLSPELAELEVAAAPAPLLVAVIEPTDGRHLPEYDETRTARLQHPLTAEALAAIQRSRELLPRLNETTEGTDFLSARADVTPAQRAPAPGSGVRPRMGSSPVPVATS